MTGWTKAEEDYMQDLADDYGVDVCDVMMLADLLGRSELYDGLVASVQDMEFFEF